MFKRIVSAAVLIAAVSSAVPPAHAEVDATLVANRKQVIHSCLLNIYLAQRKRPLALAEYQTMVAASPNDAKLRYKYGVYIFQGSTPADYSAAIVQLKKASELDPGNPQIHGTLGALYLKMKNPQEALNCFTKAIQYGGGKEYEKPYKDLQIYIQQKKQNELQVKKNLEVKKQQELLKKQNPDGTKKNSDNDDDW